MSDLRQELKWMESYYAHLYERESAIPYFYCDSAGLVTIGVGHLVDQRAGVDSVGLAKARTLTLTQGIRIAFTDGRTAREADAEADWKRVKDHGRKFPAARAREYAKIALLRMDKVSMQFLLAQRVREFIDQLYRNKPFLLAYDPRVAMAFVDVRYNPAGVSIYGNDPDIVKMWKALDPMQPEHDLGTAMLIFEQKWATRATQRYQQRHWIRVQWMRAGLLNSMLTTV